MSSSSIVASILSFSTRSSRSAGTARSGLFSWAAVMDSLLAIATGLALRVVVGAVSHDDLRTTGTIIGLWEGVVLMHFLNKMPRSYDPYVAYVVRLFVDFLVTESLPRLTIVLLWTGMGMVVADITPIFWYDMGFRRVWRRLRRDAYLITRSVRKAIPFFSTSSSSSSRLGSSASRVRFHERSSPLRPTHSESVATATFRSTAPSTISTSTTTRTMSTSTPTQTPVIPPTSQVPPSAQRRHLVPGSFPGYASETETERGSALGLPPLPRSNQASSSASVLSDAASDILTTPRIGQTHLHLRSIPDDPLRTPDVSSTSSLSDDVSLDLEHAELPDIDVLQAAHVQSVTVAVIDKEHTPRQQPMVLPPTPADTLRSVDVRKANDDKDVAPPTATMPVIPDQGEWGWDNGWETIEKDEAAGLLLSNTAKGKEKQQNNIVTHAQPKDLPPIPDNANPSSVDPFTPIPKPPTPTPIPVPQPHGPTSAFRFEESKFPDSSTLGLRMPEPEISRKSESPPPPFEDSYTPEVSNDSAVPAREQSKSFLDDDDDDRARNLSVLQPAPKPTAVNDVDSIQPAESTVVALDVTSTSHVAPSEKAIEDSPDVDGSDGEQKNEIDNKGNGDADADAERTEVVNPDGSAEGEHPVSDIPEKDQPESSTLPAPSDSSSVVSPGGLSEALSIRYQAAELIEQLAKLENQRTKFASEGSSESALAEKTDLERKLSNLKLRAAKLRTNELSIPPAEDEIEFPEDDPEPVVVASIVAILEQVLLDLDSDRTCLRVFLRKAPGKRKKDTKKQAVVAILEEHHLGYVDDAQNARRFSIGIPRVQRQ